MSTSTNRLQSSKYKCFWDFLHVQTGTQIIAVLVLINCGMSLFDLIFNQEEISVFSLGVKYFNIFAEALFFAVIFLGIRQSNAELLNPSLINTVCWGVGYGAGSILCLIAANSKSSLGRLARYILEACFVGVNDNFIVYGIVYCTLRMVIAFFFFGILYRCSKYINEKSCQENCTQCNQKCTQSDHTLVFQSSFPEVKESSTA